MANLLLPRKGPLPSVRKAGRIMSAPNGPSAIRRTQTIQAKWSRPCRKENSIHEHPMHAVRARRRGPPPQIRQKKACRDRLLILWRPDQLARINVESFCQLTQHAHTCRDPSALYRAHVAHAEFCAGCQLLLRQILIMAQTTHIDRHDLFEVHGEIGIRMGTFVLGTIIPIRYSELAKSIACSDQSQPNCKYDA